MAKNRSKPVLAVGKAALLPSLLFPAMLAPLAGQVCLAQSAAPAPSPTLTLATTLMRQAAALEKAGKYEQAAEAYDKAATAFEKAGKIAEQAAALEKSAAMYEKLADELLKNPPQVVPPQPAPQPPPPQQTTLQTPPEVTPPVTPVPAPPPAVTHPDANGPVLNGIVPLALENSTIVRQNPKGELAVAGKLGKPLDGIKLSRHDTDIYSPSIAVAPNGTIHVAFVEQQAETPFALNVYYCTSSDGGATWSQAKNLSEVMTGYLVGNCQVAVDGVGRVYVIWHTGVAENYSTDMDAHAMAHNNLVYRVLEGGAWSGKAIPVHPLFTKDQEGTAGASWFASTDPTGKVHVVWNMRPDSRHPESLTKYGPSTAIGNSMVMEAVLSGADAGTPREIFSAKIAEDPGYRMPGSDQLDTIEGYEDAAGQAHFIAHVSYAAVGPTDPNHRIHLIEKGTQTPVVNLPNVSSNIWRYPPMLLLDALGRRHIIAMYEAGEEPGIRDYVVGSDAEPTVIRAATGVHSKILGFQAYQGPNGRMIALMEMNDTGEDADAELYVSTSDGGAWSAPVNVTNNSGRQAFFTRATTILGTGHVDSASYWSPGAATATYDRQGHLLLVYISDKHTATQSMAGAWTLADFSSRTPNLLFLKF